MRVFVRVLLASSILFLAACGRSDADFNGTFAGEEQTSFSPTRNPVTATFSHVGDNLTGTYTTGNLSGTVTGFVRGNQVSNLTVTVVQQGRNCQLTGTATQADQVITANLLSSCQGNNVVVTLRRQGNF